MYVYQNKVKRTGANIESLTCTLGQLEREIRQQRFESVRISAMKLNYEKKFGLHRWSEPYPPIEDHDWQL